MVERWAIWQRQCIQVFGDVFPNVKANTKAYGGYYIQAKRLFVANGRRAFYLSLACLPLPLPV
jgi:hypothetical protein